MGAACSFRTIEIVDSISISYVSKTISSDEIYLTADRKCDRGKDRKCDRGKKRSGQEIGSAGIRVPSRTASMFLPHHFFALPFPDCVTGKRMVCG